MPGVGRQYPFFKESSWRSHEGQSLPRRYDLGGGGMKLATLQRAVARAVMQPLTRSERMQRSAPGGGRMSSYAARFIKPNDRLTSFEPPAIYNRQSSVH